MMTRSPMHLAQVLFAGLSLASLCLPAAAQPASPEARSVLITVHVPENAVLFIEGHKMSTSGSVRRFETPPLDAGAKYTYTLRATWMEAGKEKSVERKVSVKAGENLEVELHGDELSADERGVLELVNAERKKTGALPLRIHAKLMQAARGHAANMARQNRLDHTLDGKTFDKRIEETGYGMTAAGENIAQWAPTPAEAMNMWMNSPGHRTNILNPEYQEIGIGVARASNGQKYWTQVFAVSPSPRTN